MILHPVFSLAFNRSTVMWGMKFKNLMNHRLTEAMVHRLVGTESNYL